MRLPASSRMWREVWAFSTWAARALRSFPITLPPLAEQKRIAEIADIRLGEVREAEVRLRSAIEHLNEQMQEILAAAVAGELAPRSSNASEPGDAPASSRSRQIRLFEEELDPNLDVPGLSATVPEGWVRRRVDQVGEVTLGRQRAPKHERGRNMRPYLPASGRRDSARNPHQRFAQGRRATPAKASPRSRAGASEFAAPRNSVR